MLLTALVGKPQTLTQEGPGRVYSLTWQGVAPRLGGRRGQEIMWSCKHPTPRGFVAGNLGAGGSGQHDYETQGVTVLQVGEADLSNNCDMA